MYPPPNRTTIRSFIPRAVQIAFVIGLLLGVLLGWAFSGVVSAVLRWGLVGVLLLIFVVSLVLWWRVRRAPAAEPTVITWSSIGSPQNIDDLFGNMPQRPYDPDEIVIDVGETDRDKRR